MEFVAKSMASINSSITSVSHVKQDVSNGITFKLKEDHADFYINLYFFKKIYNQIFLKTNKAKKY